MTDEQRDPEPIIEVRGVSRRFGSTQALDGASLALYPGEVHALIGENGAGKSTLIKVMTGVEQPDTGELVVDGQPRSIASALDAQALGIVAIYQEPMVFPDLSVAENVFISHRDRGRIVNRGQNAARREGGLPAARRRARRRATGPWPHGGRAADRRDRQGTLAQRARPDHGRADVVAVRE